MTAAIARTEPIDYAAETRGLNFFDLDDNLRRLLDLMADTLAGALLVEEAAFDLKAGDGRKARIARRFIRTTFGPRAAIGPEPDPDHAEVERLLGYAVIDFT